MTPVTGEIEARLREILAEEYASEAHNIIAQESADRVRKGAVMYQSDARAMRALRRAYALDRASGDGVRNAVIEECAAICDAEFRLRQERMESKDPNFGDSMAQGHKSVTALMLAGTIRDLKTEPALSSVSIPRGEAG